MRKLLSFACLMTTLAAPALASSHIQCTAQRACSGTSCRDAAGMEIDFGVRFDGTTAHVDFVDNALPVTEPLQRRGSSEGANVYFFDQPDLRVAVQIFEADTPIRVRLAFGPPDAPDAANQVFAICHAGSATS